MSFVIVFFARYKEVQGTRK